MHIVEQGLESKTIEGIYRIPPNMEEFEKVWNELSFNGNFDISQLSVPLASNLLKRILKNLWVPLLPTVFYKKILSVHNDMADIQNIVSTMSIVHKMTFRVLMVHLNKIAEHEHVTKMGARELAIMFAPNIIRPCIGPAPEVMATREMEAINMSILTIHYFIHYASENNFWQSFKIQEYEYPNLS